MTALVIRKFGGACFASLDGYRRVAEILGEARDRQVVVVSARKGVTDELLGMARSVGEPSSPYADLLVATGEMQSAALLLLALHRRGLAAELIPAETVFETDGVPGAAAVTAIHVEGVLAALDRGAIPVVPGFYGAGTSTPIVTFKRGGSDFSAVALGVALRASWVELCKAEVDGVFDKDPNVDASARSFIELSHQHALEIARAGGKVLQADSAELALKWSLPLHVKPAFKRGGGTWVGRIAEPKASEGR